MKVIQSDFLVKGEAVRQYRSIQTNQAKKDFCVNLAINMDQLQEILVTQEEYISNLIDIGLYH